MECRKLLYLLLLYIKAQAIQNQEYKTARKQRGEARGRLPLTSFRINPKTAPNKKQRSEADFLFLNIRELIPSSFIPNLRYTEQNIPALAV